MFRNKLITFTLLLTGCTLICAAQLDVNLANAEMPATVPTVKPIVVEELTKNTTITKAPTTSTTLSPETTTTTTTTTTPLSTTTTSTSTTLAPPTTTTAAPNTTTAAPKTTTAAPITTTTPAPAPYPKPQIGVWNSSCIMVKMAAQLNFTYETKDNKTATALYNIPADAKVDDSHCENVTQTIQINWGPAEAQHSMVLNFALNKTSVDMTMLRFILPLMSDSFPNAKENQTITLLHRGNEFHTPTMMSYHCTRQQQLNLTETIEDTDVDGTVTVHDVQIEAFRAKNAQGFSKVHDCDSSDTSDLVPIAVGIALAALIVIVLISYLCARRRSTSRGYMSF